MVDIQRYLTKFHHKSNRYMINILLKKTKIFTSFFFLLINLNNYSHAHMKGTYSSEKDAEKKSKELGCVGIHKNQDKWLPCENEKELHKYLRK